MSREIKRVPLDFEHKGIWPGYLYHTNCPDCPHYTPEGADGSEDQCAKGAFDEGSENCPHYNHPPEGEGYQIWETVSEGSPASPVFATEQELIEYLHAKGAGSNYPPCTRAAARKFVEARWAMSGGMGPSGSTDGINFYSLNLHPFLHGFDVLSDEIIDSLKEKHGEVDDDIMALLLAFRKRVKKFTKCYTGIGKIYLAVKSCTTVVLPESIRQAWFDFDELLQKLYPENASKTD